MSRILIVSRSLLPIPSGSAVIMSNLISGFDKENAVVICETRNNATQTWTTSYPDVHYVNYDRSINGKGAAYFRWLNSKKLVDFCVKIATKYQCSQILGIFPDDFFLYAAYRTSQILNLPLHTWFHNTFLDNFTGWKKLIAYYLQPKIFNEAKHKFVMSDGMKEFYAQQYPKVHFETLVHGFKLPDITYRKLKINKEKLKFVFTGSFNDSCRDASIRLMSYIIQQENYELHLYTGNSEKDLKSAGIEGKNVFYHDFVTLEVLYKLLPRYDIMLLPHGLTGNRTDVEFRTIFPTRTIPYLCSNRPILAHSPSDAYITKFLKRHDCAFIADAPSEVQIAQTIHQIVSNIDRRERVIKNALNCAAQFDVNKVIDKLKNAILP